MKIKAIQYYVLHTFFPVEFPPLKDISFIRVEDNFDFVCKACAHWWKIDLTAGFRQQHRAVSINYFDIVSARTSPFNLDEFEHDTDAFVLCHCDIVGLVVIVVVVPRIVRRGQLSLSRYFVII